MFSCTTPTLECGDLLEIYAEKPEKCHFINCIEGTNQTLVEATYQVSGEDSWQVEEFFVAKYGLGKLKFTCCGWEPTDGKKGTINNVEIEQINPNYHFTISMFGNAEKQMENGEFIIEDDRSKVEFTVTVTIIEV